jgi:hypothetical protein
MKPTKLGLDLSHWPKFWEQLKTYLSQCRGTAHIPLQYYGDRGGPPKKKPKRNIKAGGKGHVKDKDFSKYKPKKPLTARSYSNNKWKAMDEAKTQRSSTL